VAEETIKHLLQTLLGRLLDMVKMAARVVAVRAAQAQQDMGEQLHQAKEITGELQMRHHLIWVVVGAVLVLLVLAERGMAQEQATEGMEQRLPYQDHL
jgi:hypothetical protein